MDLQERGEMGLEKATVSLKDAHARRPSSKGLGSRRAVRVCWFRTAPRKIATGAVQPNPLPVDLGYFKAVTS